VWFSFVILGATLQSSVKASFSEMKTFRRAFFSRSFHRFANGVIDGVIQRNTIEIRKFPGDFYLGDILSDK
jgi:hypothetical protein